MDPAFATLEDAVAPIDHAVKVRGIDHVGIGSDWDGINSVPAGLEDVSKMPVLTEALLRRGYSESDVRKILGENLPRVLEEEVTGP
jgi:membrane dipeptidase